MRNIIFKFDEKSVNDLYHRDNEIDENIKNIILLQKEAI